MIPRGKAQEGAYRKGRQAFRDGTNADGNPYLGGAPSRMQYYRAWAAGWEDESIRYGGTLPSKRALTEHGARRHGFTARQNGAALDENP